MSTESSARSMSRTPLDSEQQIGAQASEHLGRSMVAQLGSVPQPTEQPALGALGLGTLDVGASVGPSLEALELGTLDVGALVRPSPSATMDDTAVFDLSASPPKEHQDRSVRRRVSASPRAS